MILKKLLSVYGINYSMISIQIFFVFNKFLKLPILLNIL
jgi:hypothetical protein